MAWPKKVNGKIDFQHVFFTYPDQRGGIQDVSFSIQPGEFVGIVGSTGGGKTTILDLLARFYQPHHGNIFLDGINIQDYPLQKLRSVIGVVMQDVFLWNRSIKENLLYAKPNTTMEEIKQVWQKAQILPFIQHLPHQWDNIIGERGVKLSGGEKQRLAIAQVLLRNPQVLLLDEPTSALDAVTESLLQDNLEQCFRGKTMMVVAHRLATIRNADRIIVIEEGKVIEMGTHAELIEKKGRYYQLYSEQFQADMDSKIRD